jgi:site-specific DNA recombinase
VKDKLHIYLRVSTETQSSDGFGLDIQREWGLELSNQLKFEPIIWDEGSASSSNDSLDKRPVILDLLDNIERGDVKHLYVFNTDRLSRNIQTWGLIRYKILTNNVLLYTGRNPQPIDLSDDQQNLLMGMLGEIAQYENNLRKKRLVSGKLKKIKEGGWMGGPPPFGYHNVDGKLRPHPYERKWVNYIFEEYSNGKTTNEIRNHLLENGVKTRRGNAIWSLGSIRSVLSNTHYNGSYSLNDKFSGETIVCSCDPIVPADLYKKVMIDLKQRSYKAKGRIKEGQQKHKYLVKEFLRCGHCGSVFGARKNKVQYYNHYYCRGSEKNWVKGNSNSLKCIDRVRSIVIDQTDQIVWDTILEVLSKSHLFKETIKQEIMGMYKTHHNSVDEIKFIKKKIRKTKKELDDIVKMTSQTEAMGILKSKSEVEVKQILSVLDEAKVDKRSDLETLQKSLLNVSDQSQWVDWVKEFGDRIETWKSVDFDFDQKKTLINQFVKSIEVISEDKTSHRLKINFNVPYINDRFEWKFKTDKSKQWVKDGYELYDGDTEIITNFISSSKLPLKKVY